MFLSPAREKRGGAGASPSSRVGLLLFEPLDRPPHRTLCAAVDVWPVPHRFFDSLDGKADWLPRCHVHRETRVRRCVHVEGCMRSALVPTAVGAILQRCAHEKDFVPPTLRATALSIVP
jgi:hypothetical protein